MATPQDLLALDFAAPRTLRLVYRLGSFTAAAEAIDVKQSTVSYTIDRLRKALGDPLFVRQGGGIVATAHCRAIMPLVVRLLSEVENLSDQERFYPAEARGSFVLTCTSYAMGVLVPQLLRRVRQEAPGVTLELSVGYHDFWTYLLEGRADLAISAAQVDLNGIYSDQNVVSDYDVCIMDRGNPLAGKTLTEADLERASHLVSEPWPNFKQPHIREAEKRGLAIRRVVATTSVSEVGDLVIGTDLISAIPSRLAQHWQGRIGFARFPYPVPVGFHMYWAASNHRSKLVSWVRGLVKQEARRLGPPMEV